MGISSVAAAAAGLAFSGLTTLAAGPLLIAIFVGIGVSWGIDALDSQYAVTERLAAAIDEYAQQLAKTHEELQKSIERAPHELERGFIWRLYKWDIDNP